MTAERDAPATVRAAGSDTVRPTCNAPEGCDRPAENPSGRCPVHEAARLSKVFEGVQHH
ncbi:MAG TPA: hypothetical protein VI248_06655 [Kineosporiaceae bacterium]